MRVWYWAGSYWAFGCHKIWFVANGNTIEVSSTIDMKVEFKVSIYIFFFTILTVEKGR